MGGTDATPDALDSLSKGELDMTVFQDAAGQGAHGIEAAYLAARKQPNPRLEDGVVWIPYVKVTKDNFQSFVKK